MQCFSLNPSSLISRAFSGSGYRNSHRKHYKNCRNGCHLLGFLIWGTLLIEDRLVKFGVYSILKASLMAQQWKNLPAAQEMWVWSLGWEDPLEKEMSAHSSIPAWEISWTDEAGMLQSTRSNTLNKNNQKQGDMLEGYCSSHTHTHKELIVGFTRVVEMENWWMQDLFHTGSPARCSKMT